MANDHEIVELLLNDARQLAIHVDEPGGRRSFVECIVAAVQRNEPEVLASLLHSARAVHTLVPLPHVLLFACARGATRCCAHLISFAQLWPVDAVTGQWAPLHAAAAHGRADVVSLLLDAGAPIDQVVPVHGTALMCAVSCGHLEVVRVLLERGANVDLRSSHVEQNAVLIAAIRDEYAVFDLLVAHGARVTDVCDANGYSSVHYAAQSSRGGRVCIRILGMAGENDALETVAARDGRRPLHVAAHSGNVEALEVLLAFIETSCMLRQSDAVLDVDARDTRGCTPLMYAASAGCAAAVRLLVEYGADVNAAAAAAGDRVTPLYLACEAGVVDCCRLLLDAGARADARVGPLDYTCLHVAAQNGRTEVCTLLAQHAVATNSTANVALDARTTHGHTAVWLASRYGHPGALVQLLRRRASPSIAELLTGLTPLHVACMQNHWKSAVHLLDFFAPLDVRDSAGVTPVEYATARRHTKTLSQIHLFLVSKRLEPRSAAARSAAGSSSSSPAAASTSGAAASGPAAAGVSAAGGRTHPVAIGGGGGGGGALARVRSELGAESTSLALTGDSPFSASATTLVGMGPGGAGGAWSMTSSLASLSSSVDLRGSVSALDRMSRGAVGAPHTSASMPPLSASVPVGDARAAATGASGVGAAATASDLTSATPVSGSVASASSGGGAQARSVDLLTQTSQSLSVPEGSPGRDAARSALSAPAAGARGDDVASSSLSSAAEQQSV